MPGSDPHRAAGWCCATRSLAHPGPLARQEWPVPELPMGFMCPCLPALLACVRACARKRRHRSPGWDLLQPVICG
eukprot:15483112-Alexandrium_andersonii.AAC.1